MKKLTFIILPMLVFAVFALKNQRTIASLQATREERLRTPATVSEATGIAAQAMPTSSASRERQMTSAHYVMKRLIEYASQYAEHQGGENRRLEETEWVLSLDGKQLKILIEELQKDHVLPTEVKNQFIRFALHNLTKSHPRDVLVFLQKFPLFDLDQNSWPPKGLSFDALRTWAVLEPSAAIQWLDEVNMSIEEKQRDGLERALLDGVIQTDPYLAIARLKKNEPPISNIQLLIEQNQLKADQRLEVIHAWREHGGLEIPDDSFSGDTTSLLRGMVFGGLDMRPSAFKETTQLIEAAAFSEQEIKQLVTCSLGSEIIPAETAQWLDWLEDNRWPKTLSERWQTSLMLGPSTVPHVGKWWLKREGDPRRRGVLENCCRTIYDSARKEWIEIVKARPPGEERQFLLKSIRDGWRTDSPEEEAIRLKFVKENGLQ